MSGNSLYARDGAVNSGLQKLRFFPQEVVRGQGCQVYDPDGRGYLDLSASWGAASLGYAHPDFVARVHEALLGQAGASMLSSAVSPATALAEKLLEITPGREDRRVWLGHSGSDANEAVARALPVATGRHRVLSFAGAYHGGTQGSMAVSAHPVQSHAARDGGLVAVPYPDPYRPFEGDPTGAALLAHIEALVEEDCPGDEVSAFFIEPIQSDGGLLIPPPGFLKRLGEICARYGILTVCDEVKVGLGRTGKLHAFQFEDWTPDITVFGKGLGGGLPLSAVVGPSALLDCATAFAMQTTHGNPISASAGLAVLDIIERDGLAENAATSGAKLLSALREKLAGNPAVGDIRGRGLVLGIELVGEDKAPAPALTRAAVYRAWELGVVAYYVGAGSNVIELTPPLILTGAQAEAGAAILAEAIADACAGRVDEALTAPFAGW
ncbi:2,2-dialkylglycine decarboxylase [Citreicella sp. SE45]|nr:2,2-dialkylglycine decarboxylase [Citreicella sp. SE45]